MVAVDVEDSSLSLEVRKAAHKRELASAGLCKIKVRER